MSDDRQYLKDTQLDRRTSEDEAKEKVERVWQEFWLPILTKDPDTGEQYDFEPEEVFSLDAVKSELFDYHNLMSLVSHAYCEVTGGRISKPMTDPQAVAQEAQENYEKWCARGIVEELEVIALGDGDDEFDTEHGPEYYEGVNAAIALIKRDFPEAFEREVA